MACIDSLPTTLISHHPGSEMKNTPDGISSRLVATEEKMSEFDATARETQNKCQMKLQKIKREQEK